MPPLIATQSSHFSFGSWYTRWLFLGLLGTDHSCGLTDATSLAPTALREAPDSEASVYVTTFEYPSSRATLTTLAYKNEQAFHVPSLQTRSTSNVWPSSSLLVTGLPPTATPTIFAVHFAADRELPTCDGQRMPVELADEVIGLAEMNRNCFHATMEACSLSF